MKNLKNNLCAIYKILYFFSNILFYIAYNLRHGMLPSSQITGLHHQGSSGHITGHIGPHLSHSATATPTGSPKRRLPQIPPRGRGPRDSFSRTVK